MGLLSVVFGWPLLPVRGVIGLAEILRDQAEGELYDPAAVKGQLEEAAAAEQAGLISGDELAGIQEEAVGRLIGPAPQSAGEYQERAAEHREREEG